MEGAGQDPSRLWKVHKWARKRAQGSTEPAYFPQLKVDGEVATGVEDKIRLLRKECFPQPLDADLADIETARYPQPLQDKGGVTPEEIGEAIWKLKPDKAPGTDVITNRVVKLAYNLIGVEWARLFSACLELGYHPRAF